MKKNEGITLIALIITIIILVILAAVSITAVTQGNIIGWSSDAAAKYIDQSNLENTTLSEFESRWLSVDSVLSSKLGGGRRLRRTRRNRKYRSIKRIKEVSRKICRYRVRHK